MWEPPGNFCRRVAAGSMRLVPARPPPLSLWRSWKRGAGGASAHLKNASMGIEQKENSTREHLTTWKIRQDGLGIFLQPLHSYQ